MPDITENLLLKISNNPIADIALPKELVYPQYQGQSILNIPASVCNFLDIPTFGSEPLANDILSPIEGDYKNVILVLMDALALHRLQSWISEYKLSLWNDLIDSGVLAALTSITPSTTSAAITSLWTGMPAAWHGVTGYKMWLKEYGVVANMILHQPISYSSGHGNLKHAGFSSVLFLPNKASEATTLGTHLSKHGVQAHAFQHSSIANSGLSKMFMSDTKIHPFKTISEMWTNVHQLFETQQSGEKYVWVYWDAVDSLSHHYGPNDKRPAIEFSQFTHALEQNFLKPLNKNIGRETLFILTADHGQISTHKDPHYDINNHPNLLRRLHIDPTGEGRFAYLYIRPGQTEAVREYIERTWPNQFFLIDSSYALHNGLFGPGDSHPNIQDRIGDLIMIARGNAYIWSGLQQNPLLGRHGGLSSKEMLVPFLASKLG